VAEDKQAVAFQVLAISEGGRDIFPDRTSITKDWSWPTVAGHTAIAKWIKAVTPYARKRHPPEDCDSNDVRLLGLFGGYAPSPDVREIA
jgi:hypothetical protein